MMTDNVLWTCSVLCASLLVPVGNRLVLAAPRTASSSERLVRIDLTKRFKTKQVSGYDDYRPQWVGINKNNHAIIYQELSNRLTLLDCRTARAIRSVASYSSQLALSSDGSRLFAPEMAGFGTSRKHPWPCFPYFCVLDSETLKPVRQLHVALNSNVYSLFPWKQKPDLLFCSVTPFTWNKEVKDYVMDHDYSQLEVWDYKKSKRVRLLKYPVAYEIGEICVSPDSKILVAARLNPQVEDPSIPDGDGGYASGYLHFVNLANGTSLWQEDEDETFPISHPLFFLSPSQFVAHDTVYDLKSKGRFALSKYLGGRKDLHCVGEYGGKPGLAFFTSAKGNLELRDILHHRLLRTWRGIKNVSNVTLSPDKTILSIRHQRLWEFWKFNPRWIKSALKLHQKKRRLR